MKFKIINNLLETKYAVKRMTTAELNNRTEEEKEDAHKRFVERERRKLAKYIKKLRAQDAAHYAREKELEEK